MDEQTNSLRVHSAGESVDLILISLSIIPLIEPYLLLTKQGEQRRRAISARSPASAADSPLAGRSRRIDASC